MAVHDHAGGEELGGGAVETTRWTITERGEPVNAIAAVVMSGEDWV